MISYYNDTRGILIEGSGKSYQQSAVLDQLAEYGNIYTDLKLETTTYFSGSDHEPFLDEDMAGAFLIEADWFEYRYYHTKKEADGSSEYFVRSGSRKGGRGHVSPRGHRVFPVGRPDGRLRRSIWHARRKAREIDSKTFGGYSRARLCGHNPCRHDKPGKE